MVNDRTEKARLEDRWMARATDRNKLVHLPGVAVILVALFSCTTIATCKVGTMREVAFTKLPESIPSVPYSNMVYEGGVVLTRPFQGMLWVAEIQKGRNEMAVRSRQIAGVEKLANYVFADGALSFRISPGPPGGPWTMPVSAPKDLLPGHGERIDRRLVELQRRNGGYALAGPFAGMGEKGVPVGYYELSGSLTDTLHCANTLNQAGERQLVLFDESKKEITSVASQIESSFDLDYQGKKIYYVAAGWCECYDVTKSVKQRIAPFTFSDPDSVLLNVVVYSPHDRALLLNDPAIGGGGAKFALHVVQERSGTVARIRNGAVVRGKAGGDHIVCQEIEGGRGWSVLNGLGHSVAQFSVPEGYLVVGCYMPTDGAVRVLLQKAGRQ